MKILMFEWKIIGKEDIIYSFEKLGHTVKCISTELVRERISEKFDQLFDQEITRCNYDMVFSINYSPVIASNCNRAGIKYVSIIYDSPLVTLYSYTITFSCNYIFIFDSALYQELRDGGINTVYYMPLAVNTDRLDRMLGKTRAQDMSKSYIAEQRGTDQDRHAQVPLGEFPLGEFHDDVSFVGSMYNEKHNLFERLSGISDFTRGYLESIMEAQLKVYGCFFIQDLIKGEILEDLQKAVPYTRNKDGIETPEYIYANYFICRKIAELERHRLLDSVSKKCRTTLYTYQPTPELSHVKNAGNIDYFNQMPYVFAQSKINLNISLRSIRTGIPLRAMDVMGAEGFLLSNYQEDFLKHFEPDQDFVYFESEEDLVDKCEYYLSHEKERKEIAHNGYLKVKEYHNYPLRLQQILEICSQESERR